jgi:hypothetical protein
MAQPYQYAPVNAGSIRFLHIVSVSPEIILRVQHASLDTEPTYNALSYTWGKPVFTERATLQGEGESGYLNITPSLHHCLTHFAQYVGTNIWIDAICINQRDDAEKSHQVRQMDRVHDQATKVLMWLGPSAEDSDDAMRTMLSYGREAAEAGILEMRGNELVSLPRLRNGEEPDETLGFTIRRLLELARRASDSAVDEARIAERLPRVAVARITHRDYFTRVWIKQEITLAKHGVIHCGSHSAPIEYFHALVLFYGMMYIWEIGQHNAGLSNRMCGPFESGTIEIERRPYVLINTPRTNESIGFHLSARRKNQDEGPEPLYRLLHQSYVREGVRPPLVCFLPEDKIWGLSGIAGDMAELGLKANYGVDSADKVYENTARALLKQGRIDMLKWCRPRDGGLRLPSWVPDWRLPIFEPWSEDTGNPIFMPFRVTGSFTDRTYPNPTDEAGSISLSGVKVDVVAEIGSPWHVDDKANFSQASLVILTQELFAFLKRSRYDEEGQIAAFWRIPIGDKEFFAADSPYYVRATTRSLEQFKMLISRVADPDMNRDTASYQACAARQVNARPVRTQNGWVGLAPAEVLPGDVIVLLVGGTTPFVLRPVTLEGGKCKYVLVGESFVHGIMDGEFANNAGELVVFELH